MEGSFWEDVCRNTFIGRQFLRFGDLIFYDARRNTFSLKDVLCFGVWLGRLILGGCLQEYLQFERSFMLWRLAWKVDFGRMSAGIPSF